MNYESILVVNKSGDIWCKPKGRGRARRVCTVSQACKIMRRSRRQIYRHIRGGELPLGGRFLRELLLDFESVQNLGRKPMSRQPLPRSLKPFFPEYSLKNLNAGRDSNLILGRLLESGTMEDLRWLHSRYGRTEIRSFIASAASRLLSPRAFRFWTLLYEIPATKPSWRQLSVNPWPSR